MLVFNNDANVILVRKHFNTSASIFIFINRRVVLLANVSSSFLKRTSYSQLPSSSRQPRKITKLLFCTIWGVEFRNLKKILFSGARQSVFVTKKLRLIKSHL